MYNIYIQNKDLLNGLTARVFTVLYEHFFRKENVTQSSMVQGTPIPSSVSKIIKSTNLQNEMSCPVKGLNRNIKILQKF